MTFLNRNKLLEKQKLEIIKVDLGDGEYVYVRQMTGRERDNFEKLLYSISTDKKGDIITEKHLEDFRAKLVVNTICDEKGELILKPEDFSELSQNMSAARLERIVNAAQKLNAITEEDKEALVKN